MFKQKSVLVISLIAVMLIVAFCGAYCATMMSQNNHSCCPSSQSSTGGMDHSADHKISGPAAAVEITKIEKINRTDVTDIIVIQPTRSLSTEKITIYSPPTQLIAQTDQYYYQFKGSKDFI